MFVICADAERHARVVRKYLTRRREEKIMEECDLRFGAKRQFVDDVRLRRKHARALFFFFAASRLRVRHLGRRNALALCKFA